MIQLQDSMSGIMQRLAELSTSNSINTSAPTAGTQTDIIAVITPLQENFPYGSVVSSAPRRPSTLNILPDASVANEEEPTQKVSGFNNFNKNKFYIRVMRCQKPDTLM